MAAKGITLKFLKLSKLLSASTKTKVTANGRYFMTLIVLTLGQAMHRSSLVLVGDFVLVSDLAFADYTVLLGSDYRNRQKLVEAGKCHANAGGKLLTHSL